MGDEPLVLLVHGAWHGAWCWAALQADLDAHGIPSLAVDLPGHGASTLPLSDLYGDAQHVVDVATTLDRPVLLVGHSYGGSVISEAAAKIPRATGLVFVAAFVLNAGESTSGMAAALPRRVALNDAMRQRDDGTLVLHPAAVPALYAQCPPPASAAAVARLGPQPLATFTQESRNGCPSDLPSTYVLCLRDEAIHPDVQRLMAQRCRTVVEIDTDHSPFLSATRETAEAIVAAVQLAVTR